MRRPEASEAAVDPERRLAALVASVRLRDPRALAVLHASCAAKVRAVARRIVRDGDLADEIVADCFWQIWSDADRFDAERGSVSSWICAIARSRALDALRRRHAHARHETPLDDALEDEADAPGSACELAADRQRAAILKRLLSRVDPMQRQMIFLAFVSGLSHQEIAAHCGVALGTVKSHIRRGLTTLRGSCSTAGLGV